NHLHQKFQKSPSPQSLRAVFIQIQSISVYGGGAVFPSMVVVIKRTIKDLIHGTQQHPQVTIIATKTAMDINNDIINPLQCPNMPVIHSSRGLSIPECSCMVAERVLSPSKAFDTEPSGAVLLGIKVQHISPNIAQTPPFSANNISNAIRF
ncbi:hypothetical protein AMECASPLE_023603, partial [Ameca splendens]